MGEHQRPSTRKSRSNHTAIWVTVGLVLVALVVGVFALSGGDDGESAAGANDGWPSSALGVSFTEFDGGRGSLERYVGKPMVVNFFASWCVPCLAELPGFEEVHQELGDEVTFVGLNLQDQAADGVAVIAQTGITYDVARDPEGAVFTEFEGFAMPTTVFLGPDGNVVEMFSGEMSAGELSDRIEELLL